MEKKMISGILNFLWPGLGYYYLTFKKEGAMLMGGYFVFATILMSLALRYPSILFVGFIVNVLTAVHPFYMNNSFVKKDDAVLYDYVSDTMKTIASRIDDLHKQYYYLEGEYGGENEKLRLVLRHLKSLKIHYDLAKKALNEENNQLATNEATFAYRLATNIQMTLNNLKRKLEDYKLL